MSGFLRLGVPQMGRTSSQTYSKHVDTILRLFDRIVQINNNIFFNFNSSVRVSGCDLLAHLFCSMSSSNRFANEGRRGTWHGFLPAMTNHHNQLISFNIRYYSFMMFHVSMFQHVPVFISWKLQVHLPPPTRPKAPFQNWVATATSEKRPGESPLAKWPRCAAQE